MRNCFQKESLTEFALFGFPQNKGGGKVHSVFSLIMDYMNATQKNLREEEKSFQDFYRCDFAVQN